MQFQSFILSVLLFVVAVPNFAAYGLNTELYLLYAPTHVPCPSNVQWVRPAHGLNPSEATWVQGRKATVLENIAKYLDRLDLQDFNVTSYAKAINHSEYKNVPSLAFAISGGGYSSAYTGTGALRALDDRLPAALEQRTGGLLQSLLYQTGLSGGSWPTVSFLAHDWPTADEILRIWQPQIARPATGESTALAANSTSIFYDLAAKGKAGFPVTTADYFGRAFAYEFVPGPHGGVEMTFSSFVNVSAFKKHQAPLPILHFSSIIPTDASFYGLQIDDDNGSTYEITPFEFGGWQGDFSSFTPTEWLGTELEGGIVVNKSKCVRGFDKASFMMGSSAAAVNMWYIEDLSNGTLATFAKRSTISELIPSDPLSKRQDNAVPLAELEGLLGVFNSTFGEPANLTAYASWPNPFIGLNTTSPVLRKEPYIKLVDGSENGQVDPLWSLIQPVRGLDFIIAWDDNGDARPSGWNNGTTIYKTYLAAKRVGLPFPIIPSPATFIANNYTHSPVLFGCDVNLTTTKSPATPIVLYLANAPYSTYANFSFALSTTSFLRMDDLFVNSFNQLTAGNGTLDAEWPQCLGCAALDRSLTRLGMERTSQCARCMERYCWHGESVPEVIIGPPGGMYEEGGYLNLEMVLKPGITWAEWNQTAPQ